VQNYDKELRDQKRKTGLQRKAPKKYRAALTAPAKILNGFPDSPDPCWLRRNGGKISFFLFSLSEISFSLFHSQFFNFSDNFNINQNLSLCQN